VQKIREIEFFEKESGKSPVVEFIESIRRPAERAKIVKVFEVIEKMQIVPTAFLKKFKGSNEIWEIRVHGFRFLGFYDGSQKLILVHAFDKQSMKTPIHEIEVAISRKRAYLATRSSI